MTSAVIAEEVAWALAEQGELERAGRLFGAAIEYFEQSGATKQRTVIVCEQAVRNTLRDQLDKPTVEALLDEGRTIGFDNAVETEFKPASTGVSPPAHWTDFQFASPHS